MVWQKDGGLSWIWRNSAQAEGDCGQARGKTAGPCWCWAAAGQRSLDENRTARVPVGMGRREVANAQFVESEGTQPLGVLLGGDGNSGLG